MKDYDEMHKCAQRNLVWFCQQLIFSPLCYYESFVFFRGAVTRVKPKQTNVSIRVDFTPHFCIVRTERFIPLYTDDMMIFGGEKSCWTWPSTLFQQWEMIWGSQSLGTSSSQCHLSWFYSDTTKHTDWRHEKKMWYVFNVVIWSQSRWSIRTVVFL